MASEAAGEEHPLYAFPSASQPDISIGTTFVELIVVRANQKDVYYQTYILQHLETLVQSILGTVSPLSADIRIPMAPFSPVPFKESLGCAVPRAYNCDWPANAWRRVHGHLSNFLINITETIGLETMGICHCRNIRLVYSDTYSLAPCATTIGTTTRNCRRTR